MTIRVLSIVLLAAVVLQVSSEIKKKSESAHDKAKPDPHKSTNGKTVINKHTQPKGATYTPAALSLESLKKCNVICKCDNLKDCNPHPYKPEENNKSFKVKPPHVVMISNGSANWENWKWDHISVVLSDGRYSRKHAENWKLMCYAYSRGKLYGYVERISNDENQFENYTTLQEFIKSGLSHLHCSQISVVALELFDLFKNPGKGFSIEKLSYLLATMKMTLKHKMPREQLFCIVPWKPCIYDNDPHHCKSLMYSLSTYCDHLLINPSSFHWKEPMCTAVPEVSMIQLVYGVYKYMSMGVKAEQMIVGVPWHGYDYECDTYDPKTEICTFKQVIVKNHSSCVMKREYEALATITLHENIDYSMKMRWNNIHEAPFYNYKLKEKHHQVWLENWRSLSMKYKFVRDFYMGGVSIWTGDDLKKKDHDSQLIAFGDSMWNYLVQGLFFNHHYESHYDYGVPGKVAGAAVGCLILGALVGFLVTYCACVRARHIQLRPPFRKDTEQFMDEPDM